MVVVFREPLYKNYSNSIFSFAFFFRVIVIIGIIVIPFVLAYVTRGFWEKEGVYGEQPKVAFKHSIILIAEGSSASEKFFWSTNPSLNSLMPQNQIRIPLVKSREVDSNADGLNDEILIDVTIPLQQGETIHRVLMITAYDYQLSERVELDMEGLCIVEHSSPLPGSGVHFFGELTLKQQSPLRVSPRISLPPILPTEVSSAGDVLLPNILLETLRRNVTTTCPLIATPLWDSGAGAAFRLALALRIPPLARILYRPPAYETIKFAWIQYLAALAFVWVLLRALQCVVFRLHILPTFVHVDNAPKEPLFKKLG